MMRIIKMTIAVLSGVLLLSGASFAQDSAGALLLGLPDSIRLLTAEQVEEWKSDARDSIIHDRRAVQPRLELGYLYLEQNAPRTARPYFEEVLILDRGSAAAHVGLFRVARMKEDEDAAHRHLEEAIALAPESEAVLRSLADGSSNRPGADRHPRLALESAIDLLVEGQIEEGTARYFVALGSADEGLLTETAKDLEIFFPHHRMQVALERADGRWDRAIKDLWMAEDPTPATPANEVLAQAYGRLRHVRRHFSVPQPPGYDDRGSTWLRLGAPDRRVESGGSNVLYPSESWLYRSVSGHSLILHFVRRALGYVRVNSLTQAIPSSVLRDYVDPQLGMGRNSANRPPPKSGGSSADALRREFAWLLHDVADFDPIYMTFLQYMEACEKPRGGCPPIPGDDMYIETERVAQSQSIAQLTFAARYAHEGEPADFAVRPVAFEEPSGGYVVWVVLGHPVGDLVEAGQNLVLRRAATLFDQDWAPAASKEGEIRVEVGRAGPADVVVDGFELAAGPGSYHLGVQVEEQTNHRIGAYRIPVELPPIDRDRLRMSDVVLADRIVASPGGGGRFVRGDLKIVPSPAGIFSPGRTVWLYYELYPPRAGRANETYRVAVTLRSGRGESLPKRIFGAIEGLVREREEPGSVSIEYERELSPGEIAREHLSLDVRALPPGIYEVSVHATAGDGNTAESKATLVLTG